jgi:hypothetical protein
MNKVNTVNVIEYITDCVSQFVSFDDTPAGTARAEQLFSQLVKENDSDTTNHEVTEMLSDGWYEAGEYQLFIKHSS